MTRIPRYSFTHDDEPSDEDPPRPASVHKVKWTDNEDKMLLSYIEKHGTTNWSMVASGMPGRTGKQCRERWTNRLDPNLNREIWTPQEDAILLYQQKIRGNCWSKFIEFLPRRSANALKNRWCWLARHRVSIGRNEKKVGMLKVEEEGKKKEEEVVHISEWSDAFDLSEIPEWLQGELEGGMERWESWNQSEGGGGEKMELGCDFQCGMLSWT
jgi:hypothetical protein